MELDPIPGAAALDRPFTRSDAHRLHGDGLLTVQARDFALDGLRTRPDWWSWADRGLLCLGFALLLAGIVFFFAHNWDSMSRFARLGVVEAGMALALGGAWYAGPDRTVGRLLMMSANVLLGVFLAVFGQVYQTGADAADLFLTWAALGAVWAFTSRFAAHWILWLVVASTALDLLWKQQLDASNAGLWLLQSAMFGLALLGREAAVRRGMEWAGAAWVRAVLLVALFSHATAAPVALILESKLQQSLGPLLYPGALFWALSLVGGVLYYRLRFPDVGALTVIASSACVVILTLLGRLLFDTFDAKAAEYLIFSALILGVFSGAAAGLRAVHRRVGFPPRRGPVVLRTEVLTRLEDRGLYSQARTRMVVESLSKPDLRMPWYLHLFLGFGAWVAAGFFVAFLAESEYIRFEASTLVPYGLGFILLSVLVRWFSNDVFISQTCLALSMAGHALFLAGVGEGAREMYWVAAASAGLGALLYAVHRDPAQRFLGTVTPILLTIAALFDEKMYDGIHGLLLLEAAALGWMLSRRHLRPAVRPLLYGLAVGFLLTAASFAITTWGPGPTDTWSRVTTTAGLIAAILLAREITHPVSTGKAPGEPVVIAVVASILLGIFSSPGMTGALAIAIVGYARDDRLLVGLGLIFFPLFLIAHYYSIDATLLTKSLLLMGSGLVLLGARAYSGRRPWARGAPA